MTQDKLALDLHESIQGKIEIKPKLLLDNNNLGLVYTPGVAETCRKIAANPDDVYRYTAKANNIAVISDGSAVLGLGHIGPEAGLPVMEGKALLFKALAGIDAYPLCINVNDADELVKTVLSLEANFGAINLEDISAPSCFEVEQRLSWALNIPVFHDDQHGTAIVVLAALINALKIVNKKMEDIQIVINGAGAAGLAISKILIDSGVGDIVLVDSKGIITPHKKSLNKYKKEIAPYTNKDTKRGQLKDALRGADVFIGVSVPNIVDSKMIKKMHNKPVVFALANPVPEINPAVAKEAGASIIATGSSLYPNQVNNVLAFPGVLRGTLDVRAKNINEAMKKAAALAIADIVKNDLREDYIIPDPLNHKIVPHVASAVAAAAISSGIARAAIEPSMVYDKSRLWVENNL